MAEPSKLRDLDQEVEVVPAIRHEDAEWKLIQQNTFTRWVNNHLKKSGCAIANLETDFADGLRLICLAEALSHKRLGRYNKKVNFRSQKLENVSLALSFFQDVEHIKIVNIDSTHIVDQNKKLILGLIWTLILHYSISMGWISESTKEGQQDDTPKQKLLNWVRGRLPSGLPLTNFTSDWNDGIALGALVDSMAPGAVPNWDSMHPSNALQNTEKAMIAAKDRLGVEQLITPEELIHPEIDEMSVMTYLSQFPASTVKPAPEDVSSQDLVIPSVFARIENLEEHPIVNHGCDFEIICSEGFNPSVSIVFKKDDLVPTKIVQNGPGRFTVEFTPTQLGPHFIHLAVEQIGGNGEILPVQEKPTQFTVVPPAHLRPYNENIHVGEPIEFCVEDAVHGPVEIVIVDADDVDTGVPLKESLPGVFTGRFTPRNAGLHSINVFYRKSHLHGSPFPLRVRPAAPDTIVWGRGVEPEGIRVGDTVPVHVKFSAKASGDTAEKFDVRVVNKITGCEVPARRIASPSTHGVSFSYTPTDAGDYEVSLLFDTEPTEGTRSVSVAPRSTSTVKAFGPGLEGGIANQECVFQVDSKGSPANLSFQIEGPSKTDIVCQDKGNGAALVSYTPTQPGVYKIKIFSGVEQIPQSPFVVNIDPADDKFHPAAARVSGLETPFVANQKASFGIDTKRTNADDIPEVIIMDKDHNRVSHSLNEINPCLHTVEFLPTNPGVYHLDCRLRGVALPGCPYTLDVKEPVDISKLRMYGPGVEGPVIAKEPTHFTIDAKQAGPGAVEVALSDHQGQTVDIDVLDHQDGSFTVKYVAPRPGAYQLNVVFAGEEIPPIEINVQPRVDTSGIVVSGLENTFFPNQRVRFSINIGKLAHLGSGLVVTADDGADEIKLPVRETSPGIHEVIYAPEGVGSYRIKIIFDDEPVREIVISVKPGCDPSKCIVDSSSVHNVTLGQKANFIIDSRDAGDGPLNVTIDGPAHCPCTIGDKLDGTFTAEFTPTVPGIYTIGIKMGENPTDIPGSPFKCEVDYPHDISKVSVVGMPQNVPLGSPVEFEVNAENVKTAPITCVLPSDQPVPTSSVIGRRHIFNFTPVGEAGQVISVGILYDDRPVVGSPFSIKLARSTFPENVQFLIDGQYSSFHVQDAGREASVVVDVTKCGKLKTVRAEVTGPDGHQKPCEMRPRSSDGLFELVFSVDIAGAYNIDVFIDGEHSPKLFVLEAVKVGKHVNENLTIGSAHNISFSRSSDILLTAQSSDPEAVDIAIKSHRTSNGYVDEVTVTPRKEGTSVVKFYYNGNEFYQLRFEGVVAQKSSPGPGVDQFEHDYKNNTDPQEASVFSPREFKFEAGSLRIDHLTAVVTMPSNKQADQAEIIDNHDGSILVKYTPKTYGHHELSIYHDGTQVQGTPVKFFVDSCGDGYATVYGPGLQSAIVGEPAAFTVCAKGSHAKELSVSIEGPAQSTIKIHDNKDGTCSATWVPPVPGEYKVHVKLGKKEVRDSPFSVLVAGEGQKRSHLSVGSTSEVALNVAQTELKGISASIKSPSGIEEPCFVRLIDGGRLGVSFTPRESGEHLITVKRDGKLLPKAPFKIKVDKSQVGDANKVEVSGEGRSRAVCLQDNEILVDTSKAGFGGLSVSVQGPSKAELKCKEVKAGLIKVIYRPTEPGVYVIAIKFADHHVKDSPITVNCTGKGAGRVQQEIKRHAEQATVCLPDHEGNVFLKLPNTSPMDINARIMDPKGKTEDVEMRDMGDQFYQIRFRPQMEGIHNLSIMYKDAHVNGSPFPFTVGPFGEGGAHKVRASGMGVVRGETNVVNSFNIYTREAGSGNLSVAIEGPAKAAVEFKDHKDGNCHVDYKVAVAGEYTVAVKFNDQHIPDSPFRLFIAAATGEARKLELAQFHDNVPAGKAYTFTVLTHRAKGHLEAKVMTPNNDTETIDIVPIEEGESYALRFVPRETGNHYIHVTLDGAPMRDSPFRLRVGAKDLSDPTAVSASGEGLIKGVTGQKSEFIISTVNAGAGILNVQVDGPSKVTLDAYELELGYKVRFTPLAPGDYFAAVKYNGIHIPGSPFKIPVSGKELGGNGYNETSFVKIDAAAKTSRGTVATVPEYKGDATKVTAKGAGLNKFFPGRPAVFTIDTGLAGPNILMVGVVTTKGPCEEVIVKHQGGGHYIVNYKVHDRVKGFVFVKYGDQEIPGSPFAIEP